MPPARWPSTNSPATWASHWAVELGWIDQFHADNNAGIWNHWLLGSGAYGKVRYRF
ncbi:hypothetical protein [Synechococcus sp. RS9916]|uniref:hypothetical protein n=1 Tax=Synechococcus sp. RS9916 TaxID=221359 RepID=UPI0000E53883|nr:hypothetical protein [Synechococcus sp. RS9916]EAU75151.1 hypothetical protein RS9916_36627 [Synechococcus sp. RS9916]